MAFLPRLILFSLLLSQYIALTRADHVVKRATGALTSLSSKSKKCSVLDYGGVADGTTDIGPAISNAFTSCAKAGGATLVVPAGNYSMATGVTLSGGSGWAFQLDGLITLTADGSFGGNAIVIEKGNDIEFFSSNNLGAINGQGYLARKNASGQNARLLRFITVSDLSVHNLLLIDSPTFHLIFNGVSNLELFYLTIRGPDIGGTDGVDLICTDNCYIHDIEVTNRDECVSVKTPSQNVLIEDAYCNHSGGMSIGSLTANIASSADIAAVSNITMRNIYSYKSTQMLMIKTFPGGTGVVGFVKDSLFENFWSYDCTYGLDIDQYWESHTTPDTGAVDLSGLTFNNWTGHIDNGVSRGPIVIRGSDIVPLTDITLEAFNMWTLNGNKVIHQCKNVYGTGFCAGSLAAGATPTTFTTSMTVTATPAAYTSPVKPAWAVEGYGTTDPIPVYTPAVWWPVSGSSSTAVVAPTATTTSKASTTTPAASSKTISLSSTKTTTTTSKATTTTSKFTTSTARTSSTTRARHRGA